MDEDIAKSRRITFVTDGWTDRNGRSIVNYMGVTPRAAYFIGSDRSIARGDAKNYAADLLKAMEPFEGKVVAVVADNASVMGSW